MRSDVENVPHSGFNYLNCSTIASSISGKPILNGINAAFPYSGIVAGNVT